MIAQYMAWKKWGQWLFPLASGALAAAAMPGVGGSFVVLIALIPVLHQIHEDRGFRAGFLFGVGLFAIDMRWILTLYTFTRLIVPAFLLVVLYLSLFTGAFGLLLARLRRAGDVRWALAAAAGFALLEFLRALGPLGVSFSSLYLAFARFPALVQIAAFFGPYVITAAIVATNAFLYFAWKRRNARFILGAAAALVILVVPALVPVVPDRQPMERAAIISTLVEQDTRLSAGNVATLLDRYGALADRAVAAAPDLIVFPESFLPTYILRNPTALGRLQDVARQAHSEVVFGTGDVRQDNWYNCAVLLDPGGDVAAVYDMVRPVPFGEYVPGRRLWQAIGIAPLIENLLPADLTPGRDQRPLRGIATPICFESTFPSGSRDLVRRGGELIVTVTSDAWFALSAQRDAHFAFAVFRAVENRRWMIQSANGGISGAVSPAGRITALTRGEEVLLTDVARRSDVSLYTRWGDLPAACAFAALLLLAVLPGRRRASP